MNNRSQKDWKRHARLVGEITERVTAIVSNTTKERILDAIDEINKDAQREFYQAQQAKARAETAGWREVGCESDKA